MASERYKNTVNQGFNTAETEITKMENSCKKTGLFWTATAVVSGIFALLNFRNMGRNQGMRMALKATQNELVEPHLDYWEQVEKKNRDEASE